MASHLFIMHARTNGIMEKSLLGTFPRSLELSLNMSTQNSISSYL